MILESRAFGPRFRSGDQAQICNIILIPLIKVICIKDMLLLSYLRFSIAQLNILLCLHLQPIKTVIYSHSNKESCQDGLPA